VAVLRKGCWNRNCSKTLTKHNPADPEGFLEKEVIPRALPYSYIRKLSGGKIQTQFYVHFSYSKK